jgi:hypothetical protein
MINPIEWGVFPEGRESEGQKKEPGKEEINLEEFVNKARSYRELRDKGKDRTQEENKEFESLAKRIKRQFCKNKRGYHHQLSRGSSCSSF